MHGHALRSYEHLYSKDRVWHKRQENPKDKIEEEELEEKNIKTKRMVLQEA